MSFSNISRPTILDYLGRETFDLLVIGGGVTGCGIALDAALRGIKVALVEQGDFACGTSSRSTKLVHGGLRYLKNLELRLVHDVGRERAIVHQLARHIVLPAPMLLPIVKGGSLGKQTTSLALWMYDYLADVPAEEHRQMCSREQTLLQEPLLNAAIVMGGGLYYEYRTDDARLVIELAKTAHAHRATLINYVQVTSLCYGENKQVVGAVALDRFTGQSTRIHAQVVVNATGPFVDEIRELDYSRTDKHLRLTKGIHIVFPHSRIPIRQSVYFDMPDGRMVFAIPRDGVTYVGTTDTVYEGDKNNPIATRSDVAYLIAGVNHLFPSCNLVIEDVISSWAGLRPLIYEAGKSPSELSRHDEIMTAPSGLLSIAGGKLTGYRLMAEKVTDMVVNQLPDKRFNSCTTRSHKLFGGEFENEAVFQHFIHTHLSAQTMVPQAVVRQWLYRYGSNIHWVIANFEAALHQYPDFEQCGLVAEMKYSIEHEMTMTAADFAIRRTGMLYFDKKRLDNNMAFIQHYFEQSNSTSLSIPNELEAAWHQAIHFV